MWLAFDKTLNAEHSKNKNNFLYSDMISVSFSFLIFRFYVILFIIKFYKNFLLFFYYYFFFMKIIFIFSCSGMFRVPGFIDAL